jgi:hypothetical protein
MSLHNTKFPSLYIAGTQKGGTTSLHFLLQSHTRIYLPKTPQELHFFDIESNFKKGNDWFLSHFTAAPEDAIWAQTSPLYMYLEKVPKRIHETNREAKFIFIIRNPIDRAYSHYWNSVKYGYEHLTFENALTEEKGRLVINEEYRRNYSYTDRGYYSEQINRYVNIFGSDSILVLTQEQLKTNQQSVKISIANFLNLNVDDFESQPTTAIHNPAKLPRSRRVQRIRPVLEKWNLNTAIRALDKINLVEQKYPEMNTSTREHLVELFSEEMHSLKIIVPEQALYIDAWL